MATGKKNPRSHAAAARRNRKAAHAGAAAFAVSLFLAGPPAVATADAGGTDESSATSATNDKPSGANRPQRAASNRSARAATAGAARSARTDSDAPRLTRLESTPRAAATVKQPTGNSTAAPTAASVAQRQTARSAATTPARVRPSSAIPAAIPAATTTDAAEAPEAASAPSAAASAPVALAATPPIARAGRLGAAANVNEVGVKVLDAVANWFAMLPNQKISDLFAGTLLRVRRDLFDQAPSASPVQETTTSTGQIIGTVGAIDPEDDPLAYSVVTNPQFGTVELTDDGHYTYTPGADYAGTDSFTVKVADTDGRRNLLTPGPDGSIEVLIQVGAGASDDPFLANNLNDAALLLKNTAATISVDRKMGRLVGSVALSVPDDTALRWLDEQGRIGLISVAEVAEHWDGIESAGKVRLGIDYTLDDGTEATLILTSVHATSAAPGQYLFSGALAPDAHDGAGVDSYWDIVGSGFKTSYENFRLKNGIEGKGFRSFTQDVTGAKVHLDTFDVKDFEQARAGTDLGTPADSVIGASTGAAGRPSATTPAKAATSSPTAVTAMLPYATSVIVGQRDGSVEQWDGNSFTQLLAPGSSPVKFLIPAESAAESDQTVRVATTKNGNVGSAVDFASGKVVDGVTLAVDDLILVKDQDTTTENGLYKVTASVPIRVSPKPSQLKLGETVFVSEGTVNGEAVWSLKVIDDNANLIGKVVDVSPAGLTYTQSPRFVVGLENGRILEWTGTKFKEIDTCPDAGGGRCFNTPALEKNQPGAGWDAQQLQAMLPYGSGFVIGLSTNGSGPGVGGMEQWTGTEWKQLQDGGWGSRISTIVPFQEGFVVGLTNGAKEYWTGTEWKELQGYVSPDAACAAGDCANRPGEVTAMAVAADGSSIVVGHSNGLVQQWNADGTFKELSGTRTGWVSSIITDSAGRFVVGRTDGTVRLSSPSGLVPLALVDQSTLRPGDSLKTGQSMVSNNGAYTLTVQDDGNLVLSERGRPVWDTKTNSPRYTNYSADFQADGNFVLYGTLSQQAIGSGLLGALQPTGPRPQWNSGSQGAGGTRLVLQDDRNLVMYDANNNAVWSSGTSTTDAPPALSAVSRMLSYGEGFVVAYADGSVKFAGPSGQSGSAGALYEWADVSPLSVSGGVTSVAPYRKSLSGDGDGYYFGLDNGVVKRYDIASGQWSDMRSLPSLSGGGDSFTGEILKAAVDYAGNPQSGTESQALASDDPLFTLDAFKPKCNNDNSCGDGTFYKFNLSKAPTSLAGVTQTFPVGDPNGQQSLSLSLDLGNTAYGYVYVPSLWNILDPDEYSFGAMLALTTGPSVKVNLGPEPDGNLTIVSQKITGPSWSTAGPYGVLQVSSDITADLNVKLGLPQGFNGQELKANAYVTGGIVLSYNNSQSLWNSGWNYYTDVNYDDFKQLESVSIIPTVTPAITGTWGLLIPDNVALIGGFSLASVSLGYKNPVSADLTIPFNDPSATSLVLTSRGDLDFSAGLVPTLTDALTYSTSFNLYSVSKDLLPLSTSV